MYAHLNGEVVPLKALIDTGCDGRMYVNKRTSAPLLQSKGAIKMPLYRPRTISGFTGNDSHRITHQLNFDLQIGPHCDLSAPCTITDLGSTYDLFIGWEYQRDYGFVIDADDQTLRIKRPSNARLLPTNRAREKECPQLPIETPPQTHEYDPNFHPKILSRKDPLPKDEFTAPTPKRTLGRPRSKETIKMIVKRQAQKQTERKPRWTSLEEDIAPVSWGQYKRMARKYGPRSCGAIFFVKDDKGNQIDVVCRLVDSDDPDALNRVEAHVNYVSTEDLAAQQRKRTKSATDPASVVPKTYHDLLDVFSKQSSDRLPPSRPGLDFKIELSGDPQSIGYGHLSRMSEIASAEVKRYIQENKNKDFIEDSFSSISSPILLVHKPSGGIRFCVDYRKLNSVTKKDRYAIPLIDETVAMVRGARWLTKLDIRQAFHRILVDEGSRDLTTFQTKFGAYRYKVMPFGVANGPATWQRLINQCLMDFLDEFCVAYLDDILVYSKTLEEHEAHVRRVLQRLRDWGLQVDVDKCEFHVQETKFLGVIVSTEGLRMDPGKTKAITEWAQPQTVRDIRSFLGFANFYRRFVHGFSKKAKPLTKLTGKDVPFVWGPEQQEAFDALKRSVTSAPILRHFNPALETIVETDASDINVGGVLSQKHPDGRTYPVAYFSRNMTPAESNYAIYDKELLAIMSALESWEPELKSTEEAFTVLTDHQTLQWFTTTKKLQRRQIRWNEQLAGYRFKIVYRPGKKNGKADALTRRTQDQVTAEDERDRYRYQTLLPAERLGASARHWVSEEAQRESETPQIGAITRSRRREQEANAEYEPVDHESADHETNDQYDSGSLDDSRSNNGGSDTKSNASHSDDEDGNDDDYDSGIIEDVQSANRGQSCEMDQLREQASTVPSYEVKQGLLHVADRLYVPEQNNLRERLIRYTHQQPMMGHPGTARLWSALSTQYYFPKMREMIAREVKACHLCNQGRIHRGTNGLLQPLPVGERPWEDLTMDFVTGLEKTKQGNDAVLVVCDQFSKAKHYIECSAQDGNTGAAAVADMLIKRVFSPHGLPKSIVSDRGPQFVAELWTEVVRRLKIRTKLTTPYHPQADGQTERANQEMEAYLRYYTNWRQNDWEDWLPIAELATNALVNASTGLSPFFICNGYEPRMGFDNSPPREGARRRAKQIAKTKAQTMETIWKRTQAVLKLAKERQVYQANKSRHDHKIQSNDLVYIDTKHINTGRPRKLGWRNLGPYRVDQVKGNWATLDLQEGSRIANRFNVERLHRYDENDVPAGQQRLAPPPILDDEGRSTWAIEEVLDARINQWGDLQFRIEWEGYPADNTWWHADDGSLDSAKKTILAWYRKTGSKLRLPEGWEWPKTDLSSRTRT